MEVFFWDKISEFEDAIALQEGQKEVTYTELSKLADAVVSGVKPRSLVFCICRNCVEAVAGYVGMLRKRIVPVMLSESIDVALYGNLIDLYKPQYIWCPQDFTADEAVVHMDHYKMVENNVENHNLYEELALLLTTSGSTGSPKFVRQSYKNIQKNTESIVSYLGIRGDDRAITTLPLNYTYGLSILQSHLMAGARLVLTEQTFFDRGFWDYFKETKVTTFGAVPYTYQMLDKLRFLRMNLPSLRYITQAGGRLGEELHLKFARGMQEKGGALIVMYGATEATARMSYVPGESSVLKAGSIGIAIPGGRFEIIDLNGEVITEPDVVGELVYYGDNVTLGYAESKEDLSRPDERKGRLETGDMARRDKDGFYYVVGRKKRFLKVYGNRINLVEVEDLFSKAGFETACVGEDDHMAIFTTARANSELVDLISRKTGINRAAFTVYNVDEIPHNESGKILYSALQKMTEG